jgi:hypothetical protein
MSRRPARSQKLPLAEVNFLNALDYDHKVIRVKQLFNEGWTLASIGAAFTPPKGRSSIKAWVDRPDVPDLHVDVPIPNPNYRTPRNGYERKTPKSPGVPVDVANRLQEIAPIAKGFRARMSSSTAAAQANQEMDEIVRSLRDHHVSIADIARAANVTHRAISRRLQK